MNVPFIDSIANPLTLNCGLGNSIALDGTFISFFQGGGSFVPSFGPSFFDMNNGPINNCISINGLTAVGGVYAGTADGTLINNTTEQSVLPASGVGSLTIPANGFSVGDCFHCVVAGDCSFGQG